MSSLPAVNPLPFARFRDQVFLQCKSTTALKNMRIALDVCSEAGIESTSDLTPEALDKILNLLEGKSESAIYKILWNVHSIIKKAEKMGCLGVSPFLRRPDMKKKMVEWARKAPPSSSMSEAQFKTVLGALAELAEDDNIARRVYVRTAIIGYTGMMPAMTPYIRVADVDFDGGIIKALRDTGAKAYSQAFPMPQELAVIIHCWLASRGHHSGRKLDEDKVMEAIKLRVQGWSIKELCKKFDVKYVCMFNAVTGRTWKHVRDADAEEESPPVGAAEFLLPNLNPGVKNQSLGPKKMTGRDLASYKLLKAAGRAAGLLNLTFMDLRKYHQAHFSRHSSKNGGESVAPLIEPGIGPKAWKVMGQEMETLKSRVQHIVINSVYESWKQGKRLSLRELEAVNGDARKVLRTLRNSHPHWGAIIDMPEKEGQRGRGYGFKDPRI